MHLITNDVLIQILRERICRSGGSTQYARQLGVSCAFISALLKGKKYVSGAVLQDLGYERVISFRQVQTSERCEAVSQRTL
jgi:hypothetical protein